MHLEKELGSTSEVERGQSSLSPNKRGDLGGAVFSFLRLSSPRPSSSSYLLCLASQDEEMFPEPSRLACCFNMSHQHGGRERVLWEGLDGIPGPSLVDAGLGPQFSHAHGGE